ncbi:MAG: Gx transporter family protein [Bacillales bacterium]|nr:Gx transporter family protein [Bacillales bacterium]
MKTKKLVTLAGLLSIAVVLGIVESFIPLGIPGVKLGLANIVTLLVFYIYSPKEAFLVLILRIFLVGLLYSGLLSQAFLLSLSGGIFAFLLMWMLYAIKKSSIVTISVIGAIGHSIGQIALAAFILESTSLIYYLPLMLSVSIPSGIITGIIGRLILKALKINLGKTRTVSFVVFSLAFALSLTGFILMVSYNKKSDEGTIATITYANETIMKISLDDPSDYKTYAASEGVFEEYEESEGSFLYTFSVYNKDEKETYDLIVEVKDNEIRIKDETSSKHICSRMGYISSKYESLVCLPNQFIITLNDYKLDEIDAVM